MVGSGDGTQVVGLAQYELVLVEAYCLPSVTFSLILLFPQRTLLNCPSKLVYVYEIWESPATEPAARRGLEFRSQLSWSGVHSCPGLGS